MKLLCVHLTEPGLREIEGYYKEAVALQSQNVDTKEYVLTHIRQSRSKLYCQIPFTISDEDSRVVDLRTEREVTDQLSRFIIQQDPDECWTSK